MLRRSKELLDLLLVSGLISPSRLSIAFNVVACGLAEQQQQQPNMGLTAGLAGGSFATASTGSAGVNSYGSGAVSPTAGIDAALELLDRMFALSGQGVDVYYETYSVLCRGCEKFGMSAQAEAVLQKRYASYHSSD